MREVSAVMAWLVCGALLVLPGAGLGAPGVVLHGLSGPEECTGGRPHNLACVNLSPREQVPELSQECVDVYVTEASGARVAQLGLHLGDGWQFLGWTDGNVHPGSTFVTGVGQDLLVCVALDETSADTIAWVGTLECSSGPSGTGLQLVAPALPSGAAVLTADNEVVPLGEDGSAALVVGGDNIAGCGSGPMRMRPHPGVGDGAGPGGEVAWVTRRVIPNPLRRGSQIEWSADAKAISMEIYDVKGRLLRVIQDDGHLRGLRIHWDGYTATGQTMATGIYLVRIRQGAASWTKKVLLVQ
jgi:hypothetical protein